MGNDTFAGVPSSVGEHGPEEGLTPHGFFLVGYDDDTDQLPNGKILATNFWSVADDVFLQCQEFFPGVNISASLRYSLPITIIVWTAHLAPDTGAQYLPSRGKDTRILISPLRSNAITNDNDRLLYMTMLEVSKIFMDVQDTGWYAGFLDQPLLGFDPAAGSIGEGLSHYCAAEFAKTKALNFVDKFAEIYMSSPATATAPARDTSSITSTALVAVQGPQSACALLFIYFLHAQLGFSSEAIIASGDKNPADENKRAKLSLADVYRTLTEDTSVTSSQDVLALFSGLLSKYFPFPATPPLVNPHDVNNPWPLVDVAFVGGQQSIDVVDVYEQWNNEPGTFTNSFRIQINGLTSFTRGFVDTAITCSITPNLTFQGAPGRGPSGTPLFNVPQLFTLFFNISFPSLSLFPPPGTSITGDLVATVNFAPDFPFLPATSVPSVKPRPASMTITFNGSSADPQFQNVAALPVGTNPWFLSQDLIVFTATPRRDPSPVKPGLNEAPPASTPQFQVDPNTTNLEADDSAFAWQYLKDVLGWLNKYYTNGGSGFRDPFTEGVIPQTVPELIQSPSVLTNWTNWIDGSNVQRRAKNYHFAIARVRLNDVTGVNNIGARAPRTEVFFRHFDADADTTFNSLTTYLTNRINGIPPFPSATSSNGLPIFGTNVSQTQLTTGNNPEFGVGGLNTLDLVRGQTQSTWAYYGCFIDSIKPSLPPVGSYQWSLVAQIDFPPVAFTSTDFSPSTSTKLAQRNISFVDN